MIIRKDLKPGVRYRIKNGANYTDDYIQRCIAHQASKYGICVGFRQDFLCDSAFEGMLKLLTTDCTVIYNPRDTSKRPTPDFIMTINREGTYIFITLNEYAFSFGGSNWHTIMGDVFNELFA